MTKLEVIKFRREENSKPEKGLRIIIDKFDAIEVVLDANGLEIEQYWDIVKIESKQNIEMFP